MAIFSLLADPEGYVADTWDLSDDLPGQRYWLDLYRHIFEQSMTCARESLVTDSNKLAEAIGRAGRTFKKKLDQLQNDPSLLKPFTLIHLERMRVEVLRHYGLQDPYLKLKYQENVKACESYRRLIAAHEKLDEPSLLRVLTEGILAGNIFDLATTATLQEYETNGMDFYRALDRLKKRPWFVDDYDAWAAYFTGAAIKRAMLFVDNAGCDFVLGCLPLARVLANRGATVYLAANDTASYNDMTVAECKAVFRALAKEDKLLQFFLQTNRIRLIGSGSMIANLDFSKISQRCNEAAAGTNLLVLVGLGRAVESNWNATFTCPTLKIALMKDDWEIEKMGAKLYDPVCRFEMPEGV